MTTMFTRSPKRRAGRPLKGPNQLRRNINIRVDDALAEAADRAGSEILREIIKAGLRQRKLLKA